MGGRMARYDVTTQTDESMEAGLARATCADGVVIILDAEHHSFCMLRYVDEALHGYVDVSYEADQPHVQITNCRFWDPRNHEELDSLRLGQLPLAVRQRVKTNIEEALHLWPDRPWHGRHVMFLD